jgi:KDO2-lipid IV(A) lauroyltransferase
MKRYFKNLLLLLVYFPYRWLIQILPFRISYKLATLLGNIQYLLASPKQKHQILTNLNLVFGDKFSLQERKTILRRFYANKHRILMDLFIMGRKDYGEYFRACSVEGLNFIDEVLSRGKGLIVVTFHFGPVNLVSTYLAYRGYKITPLLVLPTHLQGVSPWVSQKVLALKSSIWKTRGNYQIITSLKSLLSVVKTQYECLKQNQIIDATGDGALGKRFVLVDFFNVKLKVSLGSALMAVKSGASIIPGFVILQKNATQHFVFKKPIQVDTDDEETLKGVVQEYIKYLESYVSRHPDYWTHWARMERESFENGVPVMRVIPGITE